MTTTTHASIAHSGGRVESRSDATRYLVPVGRLLFVSIFLMSGPNHFAQSTIGYASQQGVPLANALVPLSGVLALIGGLSVLLGYHARIGAIVLALFLVPVTLRMHNFWAVAEPMQAKMQMAMFMKNVAILGGTFLLIHFGAGPISLDERAGRM
jgi:putative oxidoreductase